MAEEGGTLTEVAPEDIRLGWLIEHVRDGSTDATIRGTVTAVDTTSVTLSDGLVLLKDTPPTGMTWYRVDVQRAVPEEPGIYWVTFGPDHALVLRSLSGSLMIIQSTGGVYGSGQALNETQSDMLSYVGPALVSYEDLIGETP